HEEAKQHNVSDPADDECGQMRTETAAVAKISQQPGDRQHADQRYHSDYADRNVALSDRQGIGPTGFSRARCSHRTSEPSGDRLYQFEQCPNRRNADRAGTNEADLCAPGFLRERRAGSRYTAANRRKMRNAPAPAEQRADTHRDPDGQTDPMPNPDKSNRQKVTTTTHRSMPTQ